MLQISKASDYALLFLAHLMRQPGRRWSVGEAASTLGLSKRFLANIVHQLGRKEIVVTQKGWGGGVMLAKDPSEVSLLEILQIFEGPLGLSPCSVPQKNCHLECDCTLKTLMDELKKEIKALLAGKKLTDLGGYRGELIRH